MSAIATRWHGAPPVLKHVAYAVLALVVLLLLVPSLDPFRQGQLATMAYFGIATVGLTLLTGISGQLSLGHGAFLAVGGYTAALMLQDRESQPPVVLILLAAMAVTLVVGAVVGVAAARLHGPYLAGATLTLAVALPGLAVFFDDVLGGDQGLSVSRPQAPQWFDDTIFLLTGKDMGSAYITYVGWIALLVIMVALANLSVGRTGRRWRAVRDDEVSASLAGINLGRARVLAFVVAAGTAGVAGAVMAMLTRVVAPASFTLALSILILSAIVVGGLGTLVGALVGAAMLTFLPQVITAAGTDAGFSDIQAAQLAPLVYGITMMLIILLAPYGLIGSFYAWRAGRRAARGTASGKAAGAHAAAPTESPTDSPARRTTNTQEVPE